MSANALTNASGSGAFSSWKNAQRFATMSAYTTNGTPRARRSSSPIGITSELVLQPERRAAAVAQQVPLAAEDREAVTQGKVRVGVGRRPAQVVDARFEAQAAAERRRVHGACAEPRVQPAAAD